MSRTHRDQNKYKIKQLKSQLSSKKYYETINNYYIALWYVSSPYYKIRVQLDQLLLNTGGLNLYFISRKKYMLSHASVWSRKPYIRSTVKQNITKYVSQCFEDFEGMIDDYELFGNPILDDDEDPDWLEYLGRTGTLEDELEYCDKVFGDWQPEDDYNSTNDEIEYAVNNWNKGLYNTELDPVQRAMNALQGVIDYSNAWLKYGSIGRNKLYFDLDDN